MFVKVKPDVTRGSRKVDPRKGKYGALDSHLLAYYLIHHLTIHI